MATWVNAAGLKLQGYMADAAGKVSTSVSDLFFKNASSPANATNKVDLFANLDSGATAITGGFNAGTPPTDTAAEATSNFKHQHHRLRFLGRGPRHPCLFHQDGSRAMVLECDGRRQRQCLPAMPKSKPAAP